MALRSVTEPGGELGQADAARQGGGEPGGLAAVQPLQPDLGGLGAGLGVGGRAGQVGGVGDGDRDVQAEQADPGAAGFLVGGLAGAGVVVGVAGGLVAAGAAGVLAAEVGGADLAVQRRRLRRRRAAAGIAGLTRLGQGPGDSSRASTSARTFWRGASRQA